MPDTVRAGRDTVSLAGEGMVDVPSTLALWRAYRAPASLIRKNDWVDRPSAGIPYLYVSTGLVLSEVLQRQGREKDSAEALSLAAKVASAARLTDALAAIEPPQVPVPSSDTALRPKVAVPPPVTTKRQ